MKARRMPNPAIILLLLLAALCIYYLVTAGQGAGLYYSQIEEQIRQENVQSFVAQDGTITLYFRQSVNGQQSMTCRTDLDYLQARLGDLLEEQAAAGKLTYTFLPDSKPSVLVQMMPYLLAGIALLFLWAFLMGRANGGANPGAQFGKARTIVGQGEKQVTCQDVAGAEEEKAELQEIVDFLRNPDKFTRLGAKIPKGVLLVGPPGTGKTLLARAVAGESDVQFLSISGSDFMELYVGVGASRVRDLFDQAKKVAPAIIFIDEIDAVGRRRGAGLGGGHDEREQTLNQLLVEMDGFASTSGVIVLAATNRQDILDPALLRPGRFDRQIYVGRPDVKGREEILRVHARKCRLDGDVDLHTVALATSGFTGADLANLINEAAILAARAERPALTMGDLDEAMMKVLAGPEKKSRVQREQDRKITAIHEAGHAVAMYRLPTHDPVHQITIIPRGQALGLTVSLPEQDASHMTRNQMYEQIVSLLGGRVAEDLYLHDISTGASNDLQRASQLARDMVSTYGMSEKLGAVSYNTDEEVFVGGSYGKTRSYSERTAGDMDDEVRAIIDRAYNECRQILTADGDKLRAVADFLLENDTMSGSQFADCMEGRQISESSGSVFTRFEPRKPAEE